MKLSNQDVSFRKTKTHLTLTRVPFLIFRIPAGNP